MHPNTIRTWSDAGRLRYFRINSRGDRRYRLGDLQRFLASAETSTTRLTPAGAPRPGRPADRHAKRGQTWRRSPARATAGTDDPLAAERHRLDLSVASTLARLTSHVGEMGEALGAAADAIRDAYGHHLVAIWELRADRLVPITLALADDAGKPHLAELPRSFGILGAALGAGGFGVAGGQNRACC